MERHGKSVSVTPVPHCLQTSGEPFGAAVLTPGTYLGAVSHRVPGRFRPLDGRLVSHGSLFARYDLLLSLVPKGPTVSTAGRGLTTLGPAGARSA